MSEQQRPANQPIRVFLSYARDDDENFVRRLYDDFTAQGFKVWYDRESMMSRGLTYHQEIRDAIRVEVDRLVYVGGPRAAVSPHVREEWKLALDETVVSFMRLGDYTSPLNGARSRNRR